MQKYQLNEIFRSIQGEGAWAGFPATFVRLQGCFARCDFCDTKSTWDPRGGETVGVTELARRVDKVHHPGDIVVVTGGEPTIQYLPPLVEAIRVLAKPWSRVIFLETSGAQVIADTRIFDWVTVSPKLEQGVELSSTVLQQTDEIKWLIRGESDVSTLQQFLKERCQGLKLLVSVQPVSMGKEATEIAYRAALANGWRLSLQLHRLIGVK